MAQKSSTTTFPFSDSSEQVSPFKFFKAKAGMRFVYHLLCQFFITLLHGTFAQSPQILVKAPVTTLQSGVALFQPSFVLGITRSVAYQLFQNWSCLLVILLVYQRSGIAMVQAEIFHNALLISKTCVGHSLRHMVVTDKRFRVQSEHHGIFPLLLFGKFLAIVQLQRHSGGFAHQFLAQLPIAVLGTL